MSDPTGSEEPTGSTPWAPGRNRPNRPVEPTAPEELPALAGEEEPAPRSNVPIIVMVVALVALLATVGVVGYLITSSSKGPGPQVTPVAPDPTGRPELPVTAGEYSRDPGNQQAPIGFGVDTSIQTTNALYRRNGQPALIVVGARPVNDPQAMLRGINATALRQVGDGWCGREQTNDLDVCAVRRNQTSVLAVGLRSQPVEEIVAGARLVLEGTR